MTGWINISGRCWTNPAGYRIAAGPVRGVLRYCAYAPPVPLEDHKARLKVRYRLGEAVPQQRMLIDCYSSADAARAACAAHAQQVAA